MKGGREAGETRTDFLETQMQLDSMTTELETARKIFWLLREDHIFLTSYNDDKETWDDGAYPAINCNDLFVPGADAESLAAEDLDAYIEAVKRWPNAGSYAWCAVKRNAKPWRMFDINTWAEEYEDAVDGIAAILAHNDQHEGPEASAACRRSLSMRQLGAED